MFKRLCFIGLGLIGGSIAKAARQHGLCTEIVALGQGAHTHNLQWAVDAGVIDHYYTDPELALANSDCVIIATPVGSMTQIFQQIAPFWSEEAIYTDVGSTKASVVNAAEDVFGLVPSNFVPAHPIAGAERSGVQAATADLYLNRRVIFTPLEHTNAQAITKLTAFWQQIGASVSLMSIEHHDTVLAATSHLPHILAFALVGLLGRKDEQKEIFKYAAGGFKDFSRIASSDPTMWQDICIANKQEIMNLIQQYQLELSKINQLLADNQAQQLFETFTYAKTARQRFLDQLEE